MKISYNWLEEYVDLGQHPDELSEMLTMAGLEVEEVIQTGFRLDGVVVGKVEEVRPHPNADRLSVCLVDIGKEEPVNIVCGAPNIAAGQHVPVATVGSTIHPPDPAHPGKRLEINLKKANIRGERSEGMICAEDELGLSDDHSGIMVLDADATVGSPFGAYLDAAGRKTADVVFDVAITPNRQDAISHIGVARDIAAVTGKELRIPDVQVFNGRKEMESMARVVIRSPEGCGRYVAMMVRGVKLGPSPTWLANRLEAIGLRPINNVVDVTNYVMYECGQPLHAFDFDRLAEGTIIVEATKEAATFTTLDDQPRELPVGTLMICDAAGPVAIAGVMGGENSEVTEDTVNVLIESAYFDPGSIRRTSRLLGLQTDASYRFERGVDPENTAWAAARAATLIADLAGGEMVGGRIDERALEPFSRTVTLRASRVRTVLGIEIPDRIIEQMLEAIGFTLQYNVDGRFWVCEVPPYRRDVEREIDVIEEVARLYGYDRIPEPDRSEVAYAVPARETSEGWRTRVLRNLAGLGFREIYTNSLLPDGWARRFSPSGPGLAVGTVNSVSQGMTTLRPSLLPGALRVTAHNQNHGRQSTRFVEFGHVFRRSEEGGTYLEGYIEEENLLLLLSGRMAPVAFDDPGREADFFDVKGAVEALADHMGLPAVSFTERGTYPETDYGMEVAIGGQTVGLVAKLSPETQEELDLRHPVFFAELNWNALLQARGEDGPVQYDSINRFPQVERDLAVVVDRSVPAGELMQTIRKTGAGMLKGVELFDVYEGDQIEAAKKSLAFALRFGADRTLTDREVDGQLECILSELERRYGASLR